MSNETHDGLVLTREKRGRRFWWAECECGWAYGGRETKVAPISAWMAHNREKNDRLGGGE